VILTSLFFVEVDKARKLDVGYSKRTKDHATSKTFPFDRKFRLTCRKHWWIWIFRPENLEYKKQNFNSNALYCFEYHNMAM